MPDEWERLRKTVEEAERGEAMARGALEELARRAKADFGCKTADELERAAAAEARKAKRLADERDAAHADLVKRFGDKLGLK